MTTRWNKQRSDEYLAGIFDGEGWITIQKTSKEASKRLFGMKNPKYTLVVGVANDCKDILDQFVNRFGGKIYIVRKKSYTTQYNWRIFQQSTKEFFDVMEKICIDKLKQIEIAKAFKETYKEKTIPLKQETVEKREFYRQEIMKINSPWRLTSND